jgi:hypothetical protein
MYIHKGGRDCSQQALQERVIDVRDMCRIDDDDDDDQKSG